MGLSSAARPWRARRAGRELRAAALASLLVLAGLAACTPVHAGRGPELAAVRVASIPDREGVILRHHLLERLSPDGRAVEARWRLRVVLREERRDFSLLLDETASRARLRLHAAWRLEPLAVEGGEGGENAAGGASGGEDGVLAGTARASVAYDVVGSAFATEIAAEAARDAALERLAEELLRDLADALRASGQASAS